MIVAAPGPRFVLHGDRGSFVKHGLDPQEADLRRGLQPGDPGWGEDPSDTHGTLTTEIGGLPAIARIATEPGRYQSFYEGMAAAILNGAPVPVDPRDAAAVMRIIAAARRSAAEGLVIEFA